MVDDKRWGGGVMKCSEAVNLNSVLLQIPDLKAESQILLKKI